MDLHAEIMNIQTDRVRMIDQLNLVSDYNTAYKLRHRDARHAAAELSLKAQARIEELEQALQKPYLASGSVANCAYNAGQYHEDWENVRHYVSELDNTRTEAIKVFRGEK